MAPKILKDQLTLSQPEGADYAHQMILAPPDFQTFLWPWQIFAKFAKITTRQQEIGFF